jgi:hypothetical protein
MKSIQFNYKGEHYVTAPEEIDDNCILSEREQEKQFDEFLDDNYEQIKVCGYKYKYDVSDVLKSVDPTAYRCEMASYFDDYIEVMLVDDDGCRKWGIVHNEHIEEIVDKLANEEEEEEEEESDEL